MKHHIFDTYFTLTLYIQTMMFQILLLICFLTNALSHCNILSFSGAGSFGAVEVGILDKLSANLPAFDMLTGVSAGGLNVGFLSYYTGTSEEYFKQGIAELKNTYFQMTNDTVFEHNTGQIARTWSYYDTAPLRKTIASKLSPLSYRGFIPALIGSTNLNTGTFQIFEFQKESKLRQIQIMMATSAIPLAFPPENIEGTYYVDGGAVANEIINGVESFFYPANKCDKYNFTFITASEGLAPVKTINNFNDFVRRVVNVVLTDFNNELAEIIDTPCKTSKGTIQICHPIDNYLSQYSSMDFSYGKELYEIGYNHFTCDSYPYC